MWTGGGEWSAWILFRRIGEGRRLFVVVWDPLLRAIRVGDDVAFAEGADRGCCVGGCGWLLRRGHES